VKLLLDEHISGRVADRLRERGHDVIAVAAYSKLRGATDRKVFELAQRQGRAVVTYDRDDFEGLARESDGFNRGHHGLVVVHPVRIPSRDIARLTDALDHFLQGPELGQGFMIWLQEAK